MEMIERAATGLSQLAFLPPPPTPEPADGGGSGNTLVIVAVALVVAIALAFAARQLFHRWRHQRPHAVDAAPTERNGRYPIPSGSLTTTKPPRNGHAPRFPTSIPRRTRVPLGSSLPERHVEEPAVLPVGAAQPRHRLGAPPIADTTPAVSAATITAITATTRALLNHANQGNFLGGFALYTDNHLRRTATDQGLSVDEFLALFRDAEPQPAATPIALHAVRDVRDLPDGRVSALIGSGEAGAATPVFERYSFDRNAAGDWLIDDIAPAEAAPASESDPKPANSASPHGTPRRLGARA